MRERERATTCTTLKTYHGLGEQGKEGEEEMLGDTGKAFLLVGGKQIPNCASSLLPFSASGPIALWFLVATIPFMLVCWAYLPLKQSPLFILRVCFRAPPLSSSIHKHKEHLLDIVPLLYIMALLSLTTQTPSKTPQIHNTLSSNFPAHLIPWTSLPFFTVANASLADHPAFREDRLVWHAAGMTFHDDIQFIWYLHVLCYFCYDVYRYIMWKDIL